MIVRTVVAPRPQWSWCSRVIALEIADSCRPRSSGVVAIALTDSARARSEGGVGGWSATKRSRAPQGLDGCPGQDSGRAPQFVAAPPRDRRARAGPDTLDDSGPTAFGFRFGVPPPRGK